MTVRLESRGHWRMRVLVIEEDVETALWMARLLRAAGHHSEIAFDASAAVRAAEQTEPPDVVLLDLEISGMSGWEVAESFRSRVTSKRPLLVAFTGYDDEADRQRSCAAGIDLHLAKPIDAFQLQRLLARFRPFVQPVGAL